VFYSTIKYGCYFYLWRKYYKRKCQNQGYSNHFIFYYEFLIKKVVLYDKVSLQSPPLGETKIGQNNELADLDAGSTFQQDCDIMSKLMLKCLGMRNLFYALLIDFCLTRNLSLYIFLL